MGWNIYDSQNNKIGRLEKDKRSESPLLGLICIAILAVIYLSPYLLSLAGGFGGYKASKLIRNNVYLALLLSLVGGFLGLAAGDQIYKALEIGWHDKNASTGVKSKPKDVGPEQVNSGQQKDEVTPPRLENPDQAQSTEDQYHRLQSDEMSRRQQENALLANQEASQRLKDIEARQLEYQLLQESREREAERPSTDKDIAAAFKQILVYDKSEGRYQLTSSDVIRSEYQRQCTQEVRGLPVKEVKDALVSCLNRLQP